jgi:hypothetical protein
MAALEPDLMSKWLSGGGWTQGNAPSGDYKTFGMYGKNWHMPTATWNSGGDPNRSVLGKDYLEPWETSDPSTWSSTPPPGYVEPSGYDTPYVAPNTTNTTTPPKTEPDKTVEPLDLTKLELTPDITSLYSALAQPSQAPPIAGQENQFYQPSLDPRVWEKFQQLYS